MATTSSKSRLNRSRMIRSLLSRIQTALKKHSEAARRSDELCLEYMEAATMASNSKKNGVYRDGISQSQRARLAKLAGLIENQAALNTVLLDIENQLLRR